MWQYRYACYTDRGNSRHLNQDSVVTLQIEGKDDSVFVCAVCDGMGGLKSGEKASGMMAYAVAAWVEKKLLPALNKGAGFLSFLQHELPALIKREDTQINNYGKRIGAECGTTAVILALHDKEWAVVNVGDSRAYIHHGNELEQITKDHSYVQMKMDAGEMTLEEAEKHPKRNVLTQCIGAGAFADPDWFSGTFEPGDAFLVCSDGFRHKLKQDELSVRLMPTNLVSKKEMETLLSECADVMLEKGEKDNISAVLVLPLEGGEPDA